MLESVRAVRKKGVKLNHVFLHCTDNHLQCCSRDIGWPCLLPSVWQIYENESDYRMTRLLLASLEPTSDIIYLCRCKQKCCNRLVDQKRRYSLATLCHKWKAALFFGAPVPPHVGMSKVIISNRLHVYDIDKLPKRTTLNNLTYRFAVGRISHNYMYFRLRLC
jgi:hypothetical protein